MASLNDELNRTIALLQQDLSVVSLEDALAILESWISQLQGLEIACRFGGTQRRTTQTKKSRCDRQSTDPCWEGTLRANC